MRPLPLERRRNFTIRNDSDRAAWNRYLGTFGSSPRLAEQELNDYLENSGATYAGSRNLPDLENPWVRYQRFITGKGYEEIWRLNGRMMGVDGTSGGYYLEAKWTGTDATWGSSPYNPQHAFYSEQNLLDQAGKYLLLNQETGGKGVMYILSSEKGREHFEKLLRQHFPEEMENGTLRVWYTPGNGM